MLRTKNSLPKILILAFAASLITCGGGGGSTPAPAPEIKEGSITGIASLGPIVNGTVTAYDFTSGSRGSTLKFAETKTANDGAYSITLKMKNTPILVCIKGGEYTEAASTGTNAVSFSSFDELCAITNYKSSIAQTISITYYTHIAYGYALSLMEQGIAVATAINQATEALSTWVGTEIISTLPIDITNVNSLSSSLTAKHKYGFANAALSSLAKELALGVGQAEFSSITSIAFSKMAFEDVKNDGRLNGKSDTGAVEIGTVALTKDKYRNRIAQNMLTMANSLRNQSSITNNNPELIVYSNLVTGYDGSIFQPITGPVIQVTSQNELGVLIGNVTFSATVIDSVKLKSVVFSLVDANGTLMTPALPIPTDLVNASISFDSNMYPDGVYTLNVDAININDLASTKQKSNLNINNTGTNVAPIAKADTYNLTIGDPSPTFLVLSNDTDPDTGPDTLTVVLDSPATTAKGATVKLNATQTGFIYTPSAAVTDGTIDVFSYYAFDGKDKSTTVNVTVTALTQANRNPFAQDLSITAVAGSATPIQLTGTDPDGDQLTVVIDLLPTNGEVVIGFGLSVSYTGTTAGNTSFTYYLTDGRGGVSNIATVSINVSVQANRSPTADNLSTAAQAKSPKTINLTGSDPDGDALTVKIMTQPTNGSVVPGPNQTAIYTGAVAGQASFTYSFVDTQNAQSNIATVSITVSAAKNTPPTVAPILDINASVNGKVVTRNIIVSDPDNQPISPLILKVSRDTQFGSSSILGTTLTYKPPTTAPIIFPGPMLVTISVSDGIDEVFTSLNVTLTAQGNLKPKINLPLGTIEARIGDFSSTNIFVLATDPDNFPNKFLETVIIDQPRNGGSADNGGTVGGKIAVRYFPPKTGTITTDNFTIAVFDGQDYSNTETVTVNLLPAFPADIKFPTNIVYENGSVVTGLRVNNNASTFARGSIYDGVQNIKFLISGGTGRAVFTVVMNNVTYTGTGTGTNQTVTIPNSAVLGSLNSFSVNLKAAPSFSDVTFKINWSDGTVLPQTMITNTIYPMFGSAKYTARTSFRIGSSPDVNVGFFGADSTVGIGNMTVYVRFGAPPTKTIYDRVFNSLTSNKCNPAPDFTFGVCGSLFYGPQVSGVYHLLIISNGTGFSGKSLVTCKSSALDLKKCGL